MPILTAEYLADKLLKRLTGCEVPPKEVLLDLATAELRSVCVELRQPTVPDALEMLVLDWLLAEVKHVQASKEALTAQANNTSVAGVVTSLTDNGQSVTYGESKKLTDAHVADMALRNQERLRANAALLDRYRKAGW